MAGYEITYGSSTVYTAGSTTYAVHGVKLKGLDSDVGTLSFVMPPDHPLISAIRIRDFTKPVVMTYNGDELFYGYVTSITRTMYGEREVLCKSELMLLAETHIRISDIYEGYGYRASNASIGKSARDLFIDVMAAYNFKQNVVGMSFTIGHNVSDNAIGRRIMPSHLSVEYNTQSPMSALDVLRRFICEPYNCMLKVWRESGTRYIGLYTSTPDTSTQVIRFGENMTTFEMVESDEDFYTGVYPIGGNATDYSNATNVDIFHLTQGLPPNDGGVLGDHMYIDAGHDYDADYPDYGDEDTKIAIGDIFVVDGVNLRAMSVYRDGYVVVFPVDTTDEPITQNVPHTIASGTLVYYKGHTPRSRETSTVTLYDVQDGLYGDYRVRGPILIDEDAADTYGLRTFTYTDELFYPEQLLESAKSRLAEKAAPSVSISVDAVDMAYYSSGKTHLKAGQRVRVVHEPYDLDLYMQVTEIDVDLDNPGSSKHLLGSWQGSVTRALGANRDDIAGVNADLATAKRDVIPSSSVWGLS